MFREWKSYVYMVSLNRVFELQIKTLWKLTKGVRKVPKFNKVETLKNAKKNVPKHLQKKALKSIYKKYQKSKMAPKKCYPNVEDPNAILKHIDKYQKW